MQYLDYNIYFTNVIAGCITQPGGQRVQRPCCMRSADAPCLCYCNIRLSKQSMLNEEFVSNFLTLAT